MAETDSARGRGASSGERVKPGAVVIGRNEGERLQRCLRSLSGRVSPLVYVDSNSTDGSVAFARSLGVEVVELDLSIPFTAARARNEGFQRLRKVAPEVAFVQFVDGDCEVVEGWVEYAQDVLANDPGLVAVTGVRRERYPEATVFNELCDIEWQLGSYGETDRFGGDVMIRASSLEAVGGYNPGVIAAEDDELAVRLHQAGGRILRANRKMTVHDAAIHRLSQWWQRAKRAGHGYAQVEHLHGDSSLHKFRAEKKRVLTWGVGVPAALLALAPPSIGASLLLAGVYPLRALRIARNSRLEGMSPRASAAWGLSCAFTSFPEAVGMAKFHVDRLFQRAPKIIEYKGPEAQ
jgi:GT2 family glycosyltransferase